MRTVGKVLQEETREIDAAARVGGDEFAVLLPGVSPKDARAAAERLRIVVDRELELAGLDASISIGVATREPPEHPSLESLLADADIALYAAKRAGGDRVRGSSAERQALTEAR